MLLSLEKLEAIVWGARDARRLRNFRPAPPSTPRGEHARMLAIAAARRLRAAERAGASRCEDADYWKAVAPSALTKARGFRDAQGFASLPG